MSWKRQEKLFRGGQWKYNSLIITLIAVLLSISWSITGWAQTKIYYDTSNWPDELKLVCTKDSDYWTYGYTQENGHYSGQGELATSGLNIQDYYGSYSVGPAEYDSDTNVYRIPYSVSTIGNQKTGYYFQQAGILWNILYNNASVWYTREYTPETHRYTNSTDLWTACPEKKYVYKAPVTFKGETYSLTKTYSRWSGIYVSDKLLQANDSDSYNTITGYLFVGNIPKGMTVKLDVRPDMHVDNNDDYTPRMREMVATSGTVLTLSGHTHNTNAVHYTNSGQRIYNGHAQHYVHKWYSCDANDGYTKDNGEYYYEDCYDKDDNGSCDFCGRKRVWVNINVCTPEGNEDTSGGTAKFDVSWYDNLALGATQNHSATQVSDQPYSKVWVGTQIWLANINMQKSYLYLSGVSGATQSGNQYYYTVQDTSHSININTAYKSYALTINPNGGTLNVSDNTITKNSNGTAKATVTYNSGNYNILGITASRTHYIMDGFYTAASGGTKLWNNGGSCLNGNAYWNSSNKWCYAGDVTVYAHWKDAPGYHNGQAIVYTITYNLFPKNGNGTKITDPGNPTTYTIETPTFTLKNPSATGYDFEGWYGSGTNGSKGVTIVQGSMGDLYFTADWLPTKDTSKSSSKDQNIPYVKTTPIIENNYKLAS